MNSTITETDFEKEVLSAPGTVLVAFHADWCTPCRMVAPMLEEVATARQGLKICKINVDDESDLASAYRVLSVPTLVVFKDGAEQSRVVGLRAKGEILAMLD